MPTVQFLGKIHPHDFNVSITGIPPVKWSAEELGLEMVFKLQIEKIENSDVHVECEVNRCDTSEDLAAIWMRALDLVRGAVDLVCFATGTGATVTLDTFINAEGARSTLLSKNERLSGICTAFRLGEKCGDLYKFLNIVLTEPGLFMALNDLVTANTLPHYSPVTCARTIEGLRHLIAPGLQPKDGWSSLRQNLNIDENYLKFITDHSKGPRHGDPQHIPGAITTDIITRTWVIMNRFLEYRKRGNDALP
jgi:hypothetical protein